MASWQGHNVFVTGATGLLGSAMVEELCERGASVTCLVRDWVPASRLLIPAKMDPDVIPESFSSWSKERAEPAIVPAAPVFEEEAPADTTVFEADLDLEEEAVSPIAEAAADVSARLDALMDQDETPDALEDWPDTLVDVPQEDNIVEFHPPANDATDDAALMADEAGEPGGGLMVYVTMALLGLAAALSGLWFGLEGSSSFFGQWGPHVTFAAIFIGALLFMAGTYYFIKTWWKRSI